MPAIRSGTAMRTICLCVDAYEAGALSGRAFYLGDTQDSFSFHNLMQMLARTEHLLDTTDAPQSYTAKRFFAPLREDISGETDQVSRRQGKCATFLVRVMFRQHATWQGSVTWREGKSEQSFRSALELLLLIDGALGGGAQ